MAVLPLPAHPEFIPLLRRREFLVVVSAALAVTGCGPGGRWRAFSDQEARTLAALCDGLIPADEFPSATEAGAIEFFDRWMAGGGAEELVILRAGLAATDAMVRAERGQDLASLDGAARDALLRRLEAGEGPAEAWTAVRPRAFFDLLLTRTMHAYYSDPRHGGNRDRVSWRMVGLPDPPVRGRQKEG